MIEVDKCRLEPDKDKRVAQILATDVTREQLAEAVWSMERTHAIQHDLIMELMDMCNHLRDKNDNLKDENAKLRNELKAIYMCDAYGVKCKDCKNKDLCAYLMREPGIEVE